MPTVIPADYQAVMAEGSFTTRNVADVFYQGQPTLTGLPLAKQGNISGRASGSVQTSGRFVVKQDAQSIDEFGSSLVPSSARDALSVYGQEVVISRQVLLGSELIGSVPYGRFRLTGVPTAAQTARRFGNAIMLTSGVVEVEFKDLFEPIIAADFTTVESPKSGGTMWSEARRLSLVPVVQSVADMPVSAATIYGPSRMDAITDLFRLASAQPHLTRQGALTARLADPFAVAAVDPIVLRGTVQSLDRAMSNDFKNWVVVTTTINGAEQIVAEARITEGPLSISAAGPRVERRAAGLATTRVAQQNLANAVLAELIRERVRTVRVTCVPDMRLDLGDPVIAYDPQTQHVEQGIVAGLTSSLDPTSLQQVEIATEVPL